MQVVERRHRWLLGRWFRIDEMRAVVWPCLRGGGRWPTYSLAGADVTEPRPHSDTLMGWRPREFALVVATCTDIPSWRNSPWRPGVGLG